MKCTPSLVVLVVLCAVVPGCARDPSARQSLRGTVVWNKAALERGTISFVAEEKPPISTGAVVVDGEFAIPAEHGLPPGRYQVRISSPETLKKLGDPVPRERLGKQYNAASTLRVEVTADGPNRFNFDLD
jgi:hypothetical protein